MTHDRVRRVSTYGWVIGTVAALLALACGILAPDAFFPAYLASITALSTLAIGCLPVLMILTLVPGKPSVSLRPALEAGLATIPVVAVLFVPVLIGLAWIYPWAQSPGGGNATAFRAVWLWSPAFIVRTILYFGVLTSFGWGYLRAASTEARKRIAIAGLIFYAVLTTFAGIDWLLSIEPKFHSSIFGLMVISQQMLGGLALAVFVTLLRTRSNEELLKGVGGLLISTILLWAYLHAMQFIIIWAGDLPLEVEWYLSRGDGVWAVLLCLLALCQGFGPFLLLLFSKVRESRRWLITIAAATIVMRFVETAWLVLPARMGSPVATTVSLTVSIVATGCLWLAAVLIVLGRTPARSPEPDDA